MQIYQRSRVTILDIKSEITIKNSDLFRTTMQRLLNHPSLHLILNLEHVTYLNSSALGIIADIAIKAKEAEKELVITGIQSPMNEIFEVVKFDTFMKIFSTAEEAIDYFEQH
ncbi:STAS domain-containing protein [Pseudobacillus wudalianchiensis]|uniref:Anti-sigma factor antagonist n=1 Tax=Pseudobacillus wudalianchiensis TaxID=1743143 RepID=A0A1B9ADN6_9BACI|nr:STAS domain-containing protein [Bacillus wudalianchiensis]OCA81956.1 hypothetical protein A8F95_14670 [Bacillus wudalianchiensis]